jgi:hypothetical protein
VPCGRCTVPGMASASKIPAALTSKQLAAALEPLLAPLPAAAVTAVSAAVAVTLIDRYAVSMPRILGPLPQEVSITRIAGADCPGTALSRALTAIAGRYPYVAETVAVLDTAARDMTGSPAAFGRVAALLAGTGLQTCSGSRPVDVVGDVYGVLRSVGARRSSGAYFTPPSVGQALALMLSDGSIEGGQTGLDPACGTGALLMAKAAQAREDGIDPYMIGWFGIDLDPVAVGLAALNAVVWDLGPFVWLHAGDGLTDRFVVEGVGPVVFDVRFGNPPFNAPFDPDDSRAVDVPVDPHARLHQMRRRRPERETVVVS